VVSVAKLCPIEVSAKRIAEGGRDQSATCHCTSDLLLLHNRSILLLKLLLPRHVLGDWQIGLSNQLLVLHVGLPSIANQLTPRRENNTHFLVTWM
jgi:hypothetical protein